MICLIFSGYFASLGTTAAWAHYDRLREWYTDRLEYEHCSSCGGNLNALCHDGWNGYYVDENLACRKIK